VRTAAHRIVSNLFDNSPHALLKACDALVVILMEGLATWDGARLDITGTSVDHRVRVI
jgi:hypothetical protein